MLLPSRQSSPPVVSLSLKYCILSLFVYSTDSINSVVAPYVILSNSSNPKIYFVSKTFLQEAGCNGKGGGAVGLSWPVVGRLRKVPKWRPVAVNVSLDTKALMTKEVTQMVWVEAVGSGCVDPVLRWAGCAEADGTKHDEQ
jgi:hypothetical protein